MSRKYFLACLFGLVALMIFLIANHELIQQTSQPTASKTIATDASPEKKTNGNIRVPYISKNEFVNINTNEKKSPELSSKSSTKENAITHVQHAAQPSEKVQTQHLFKLIEDYQHTEEWIAPSNEAYLNHGQKIQIEESRIKSLSPGQQLLLPVAEHYPMTVDSVEHRKNGSAMVKLNFPNTNKVYRGFITFGRTSSFGRIVSPQATYELEITNGRGWIVDTIHIDSKMPKGSDAVVVDDTFKH